MAPKCPKCSTELKDDYGMVTCPGCGSIVFVDMEGVAQVASEPTPMEPAPLVPDSAEPATTDAANSEVDMNAFLGYEQNPETSQNDPNDPLGLSAYANSEMSSAQNGPLVVTLIISGIDAKDLRDEVRQALQDSRFGWDAAALMSNIKGGVLRIEQVSPVKATIVINRIKNLSVRIRWEQNAITEIDPANHQGKST